MFKDEPINLISENEDDNNEVVVHTLRIGRRISRRCNYRFKR